MLGRHFRYDARAISPLPSAAGVPEQARQVVGDNAAIWRGRHRRGSHYRGRYPGHETGITDHRPSQRQYETRYRAEQSIAQMTSLNDDVGLKAGAR
jgi:hypothetical protein